MKRLFEIFFFLLMGIVVKAQDTIHSKNTDAVLYLPQKNIKGLIVGLGGSEGGNAWASNHWKSVRDQFLGKDYAFLAVAYFGSKNSPKLLEKIEIQDVYNTISIAKQKIHTDKIAIVGGSRGADLALLLGSYYPDISCIIALSASHAVFPGNTSHFSTSSWTFGGRELPFVPVNEAAVPFMIQRNIRKAFEAMLQDKEAESRSLIKVENAKASILLMSGNQDEICPSSDMSEKMIQRLKNSHFKYHYEHIQWQGGHTEPYKHFDRIFAFLQKYF
ncbi:alpha/beta hydrolase [Chryseobacterium sp. Tr-659]|uniref:acyl-CoA thioester hydrolase/BAAT C-terminal domain-containing protein n=1 Tax=Chryseobacterium sp. Tr-659 TaxID=2608340 RepID=UPI00142297B4|nr:acyl-CoA thioester hydrolase/BAAT C-terminal domain-containing protein [Chryseobacterium sp. Tr-659]NIF06273.1 alpha/beta hydrolase [Chryseobacterium sp. Tr-659]